MNEWLSDVEKEWLSELKEKERWNDEKKKWRKSKLNEVNRFVGFLYNLTSCKLGISNDLAVDIDLRNL